MEICLKQAISLGLGHMKYKVELKQRVFYKVILVAPDEDNAAATAKRLIEEHPEDYINGTTETMTTEVQWISTSESQADQGEQSLTS